MNLFIKIVICYEPYKYVICALLSIYARRPRMDVKRNIQNGR